MAVSATNLTHGEGGTGFTSKATASISPSAGKLYLISITSKKAGQTTNVPTVTGCSLTWVQVNTVNTTVGQGCRTTVVRAMGTPTTGTLTIDWAGQSQDRAAWSVDEFSGVVTTGSNGADAVVQSNTNQGSGVTSLTVTLSTFGSSGNAAFGTISAIGPPAWTVGSGFTELANQGTAESGIEVEFKNSQDTSVDWTFTSCDPVAVAIEIKAGAQLGVDYWDINKGWGIALH